MSKTVKFALSCLKQLRQETLQGGNLEREKDGTLQSESSRLFSSTSLLWVGHHLGHAGSY